MTTGTAVQKVDGGTGEVLTVETFDFPTYLAHLTSDKALKEQSQLAAVYDAACRALIGPNDVQREGSREFKKKSAWRKLQRHFGISTEVVRIERGFQERAEAPPVFVATVTVRASAPWGQQAEAVGACGTDEESGRRKITIADAIATAETRATNRAVSNLIAMGEVSAEEMQGKRDDVPRLPGKPEKWDGHGGKPLNEVPSEILTKAKDWLQKKDAQRNAALIQAIEQVLEDRRTTTETAAMEEEDDDLPF